MATTTGVPPTRPSIELPRAPDKNRSRFIKVALWMSTGAAAPLWINTQIGGGPTAEEALIWLFAVAVLSAWPAYFGWRAQQSLKIQIDQLQQHAQATIARSYEEGYAAGYLACAAERFPSAE